MVQICIGKDDSGCRIDRILRKRLPLKSLSEIYSLIRKGKILVDGKRVKQNYRVEESNLISLKVDQSELAQKRGPDQNLRSIVKTAFYKRNFSIVYEDDFIIACNKPSGLVVHPGTGHLNRDTLIELASGYLLEKGLLVDENEPALVHRIDRDTSGIVLIAKNKRTLRSFHDIFRNRDIVKQYIAICHHKPPKFEDEIILGISKSHHTKNGTKMCVNTRGQETRSRYRIVEYSNDISRIEVFLETGKTHQIRVQMAHIGAPIIGDNRYGNPEADNRVFNFLPRRLYLHAFKLSFVHPVKRKKITITAPQPEEFSDLFRNVNPAG